MDEQYMRRALALAVRAVGAVVAVDRRALVKDDAVMMQRVDEHLDRAGHLALGVGVLHAQEEHAAGLMRHALGDQTLNQISEMHEARRRRRHARHDRALGQLALRIARLERVRRLGHVREE